MKLARRLGAEFIVIFCITLLGGVLAAALARYSPGYGTDVGDMDSRLSEETIRTQRLHRGSAESFPAFYCNYLSGILRGDFGISESFRQPIGPLIVDRLPYTAALVSTGAICGWLLALVLSAITLWLRNSVTTVGISGVNGILLAFPPAVFALLFFYIRAPLTLAMTLILLPRLYGSLRSILNGYFFSDAVIAARARGISAVTLAMRYFLMPASGKLAALFGTAIVIAFGCAVPIEALCNQPGIGQLTWRAAQSRDLPLISALALILTVGVTTLNACVDLLAGGERRA